MQRGNRVSSRKRFFQHLNVEGTSATFEHGHAYESGEKYGTSSRRRFFQNLGIGRTTEDNHSNNKIVENALDSQSSSGQAHYQKQQQGTIIEYKDFGDNIFECVHCSACYWQDEMNTRGIYTGCCKGGQVFDKKMCGATRYLSLQITIY